MREILVASAKEDAPAVVRVVAALAQRGVELGWKGSDPLEHASGAEIAASIGSARAYLVFWSQNSVTSARIRAQAGLALARSKLVQVTLDETTPPMGFVKAERHGLADWSGDPHDPALADLVSRLSITQPQEAPRKQQAAPPPPPSPPRREAEPPRRAAAPLVEPRAASSANALIILGFLVLVLATVVAVLVVRPAASPDAGIAPPGKAPMELALPEGRPADAAPTQASADDEPPIPTMDELFGAPAGNPPAAPAAQAVAGKTVSAPSEIFPVSADTLLVRQDLAGLTAEELWLARNEIYARHGRIFKSPTLAAHFARFPWYQPRATEVRLNAIEAANVRLISDAEGGR